MIIYVLTVICNAEMDVNKHQLVSLCRPTVTILYILQWTHMNKYGYIMWVSNCQLEASKILRFCKEHQ